MTMIERMDAIEARLRVVEEKLRSPPLEQREIAALPPPPGAIDWLPAHPSFLPPRLSDLGDPEKLSTELLTSVRDVFREELARSAPVSVEPAAPAVPDELHRELEEAAYQIGRWYWHGYEHDPGSERTRALLRLEDAVRAVELAREGRSEQAPRADSDGAISGTDSGAISTPSGALAGVPEGRFDHRWRASHIPASASYECEKCGDITVLAPGSVNYSGPCPARPTPRGSGPWGS